MGASPLKLPTAIHPQSKAGAFRLFAIKREPTIWDNAYPGSKILTNDSGENLYWKVGLLYGKRKLNMIACRKC